MSVFVKAIIPIITLYLWSRFCSCGDRLVNRFDSAFGHIEHLTDNLRFIDWYISLLFFDNIICFLLFNLSELGNRVIEYFKLFWRLLLWIFLLFNQSEPLTSYLSWFKLKLPWLKGFFNRIWYLKFSIIRTLYDIDSTNVEN